MDGFQVVAGEWVWHFSLQFLIICLGLLSTGGLDWLELAEQQSDSLCAIRLDSPINRCIILGFDTFVVPWPIASSY